MKMPEVVKRTKDYIIVKVYIPDDRAADTLLAKRKDKAKGIRRGLQSYKVRFKG